MSKVLTFYGKCLYRGPKFVSQFYRQLGTVKVLEDGTLAQICFDNLPNVRGQWLTFERSEIEEVSDAIRYTFPDGTVKTAIPSGEGYAELLPLAQEKLENRKWVKR